jgi:hypothetical protein
MIGHTSIHMSGHMENENIYSSNTLKNTNTDKEKKKKKMKKKKKSSTRSQCLKT